MGTPTSGTLANPGDQAVYTFAGTQGERIFFNSLVADVGGSDVQLFDPYGNQVFSVNWGNDQGPLDLEYSGTYRLVFSLSGSATGSYGFRVLDAATQPVLTLGSTQNGTLNPGVNADIYQINGTQGQRLLFHSLTTSNAGSWTFYGIGNQQVASTNLSLDFTVTLPETGTDLLVLSGNNASNPVPYSFQVSDVSGAAVSPTGFDVVHTGTIAAGATATYTYTAPAGLLVRIDNPTPSSQPIVFTLLDPSNTVVATASNGNNSNPLTLQTGGTYTLDVQGTSSTSTGSYTFSLFNFADAPVLTLGTEVSGTLTNNQDQTYQFSGSAGERVFYNGLQANTDNVNVYLTTPSGAVLFNQNYDNQIGPETLPTAGTYYLTIINNLATTEAYSFTLFNSAVPITPLVLGTAQTGTLANPGDQAVYTFTAVAGERVFYNATVNSSGILAELQGPSGHVFFNQNAADQIGPEILTEPGTYTLVIYGSADSTGAFGFNLFQAAVPGSCPLDFRARRSPAAWPTPATRPSTPSRPSRENASSTTRQSTAAGSMPSSRVRRARFPLNQNAADQIGPEILTEPGTYTLVIYGNADDHGRYGFDLLQAAIPIAPPTCWARRSPAAWSTPATRPSTPSWPSRASASSTTRPSTAVAS